MKHYFNHIKLQTPHARRQHSAHVAGFFTALAFVVWITTLGMRFDGTSAPAVADGQGDGQSQLASVASSMLPADQSSVQPAPSTDNTNSLYSNYGTQ